MKLPKCPHCDKLLVGLAGEGIVIGVGLPTRELHASYFCPETMNPEKPEWVEVMELTAGK